MSQVMKFEITSKDGVLLETENRYCTQNIKVVPRLTDAEITKNGEYTPPEGSAGFGTLNVSVDPPSLTPLSVTENGTYPIPDGHDGYSEVTVNVNPPLETLTITEKTVNGTYTPSEGKYGFDRVEVNITGDYAEVETEIEYSSRHGYCCSFNASDDFGYTGPGPLIIVPPVTTATSADGPFVALYDGGLIGEFRGMTSTQARGPFYFFDGSTFRLLAIYTGVNNIDDD